MLYSVYKLNKLDDKIQPCCTSVQILNQSVVPHLLQTVAPWPAYKFLRRQVMWSDIPISFRKFQFVVIHTIKHFSIVNETGIDVFLEFRCFFYNPTYVGNLISGSSPFSKARFYIWKFLVHIILKPSLKDLGHTFATMLNECICTGVWTFFGIALLWDWDKNWSFRDLWPLLSFLNLLKYWVQPFNNIIF